MYVIVSMQLTASNKRCVGFIYSVQNYIFILNRKIFSEKSLFSPQKTCVFSFQMATFSQHSTKVANYSTKIQYYVLHNTV